MRQVRFVWMPVALVVLLAVVGCADRYTPVPVSGVVRHNGKPVEGASVTFYLINAGAEGRPGTGTTDANGAFKLHTFGNDDGALPGEYKVVINKWVPTLNLKIPNFPNTPEGKALREDFIEKAYGNGPRIKNILPSKYGDQGTTPLTCKVDGPKTVEYVLEN